MVNPQPTRTVSGQVLRTNNTPFGEPGFTLRAFDAISPSNIVPLGNPIPLLANGSYRLSYTWQSTGGRNGPNLLVRVFNPQGTIVGEATKPFAGMQETLNITVNVPPPPPPPPNFTLACTVRNQLTTTTIANLRVEATFRVNNQILLTRSGTTNAEGLVLFNLDRAIFNNLPSGQSITVNFQVFQGTQPLQTTSSIPNLQPQDQKFDILITLPPKNYLVKGTIRQSNSTVLAGAIVHADNVKQGSVRLGTTRTESNGNYEIRYTLAAEASDPDLVISVYNEQGQPLAVSPRRDNAKSEETIDLTLPEPEPQLIVKGTIRQADSLPLENIVVRAFDRDLRSEQLLGQQITNSTGYYEIAYTRAQFRRAEKERADLVLRLFTPENQVISAADLTTEDGTPLENSSYTDSNGNPIPICFSAPTVAVINGTVTDARYQGLSEHERNTNELTLLLDGASFRELTDADIQFLFRETSIPYEQIEFLRLDAHWSSDYQVDAAIFYGLLRQGLSRNLRQLLSQKPDRWRTALQAALDLNIIPTQLRNRLDSIINRLSTLAVELAFVPDSNSTSTVPLGVKLATASLTPEVQRRVVTFILQYDGDDGDDIWQALQAQGNLTPADLNTVRFTLESDALLLGHLNTLQAVQQLKQTRSWQSTRDLAQLKRSDWEQITAATTPNNLPDGFKTTKAYAEAIADRIEQALPTDVFRYRLAENNDSSNADVLTFLNNNLDFDLLQTPIDTFLKNGAELGNIGDLATLPAKIKTFSRVARLTPDRDRYPLTQGLIRQGYDSALKIAAVGKEEFIGKMTPIAGSAVAGELHANARARADAANLYLLRLRDLVTDFIPSLPSAKPTGELAEWTKLFGSLNSCQCNHCRSVHSPAAYLVDMLEFLKKVCLRKNARGECELNLQQVLFDRRPDLAGLKLNCDNSNTPLPHIDLVNELLEKHVAPESTPAGWPYQTVGSTEEDKARLRAIPAYEHAPAYEKLAEASYPWLLPFDLHHERSHLFAQHLNINLWEVRKLFNRDEQEITRFYLGMNQTVWEYITTTQRNASRLAEYWGLETIAGWATREPVPTVLKRTGLTYEALKSLLDTRHLAGRGLSLDTDADPCDIQQHFLVKRGEMPSTTWLLLLDRLHRFLRLRQALNWSIEKLDTLLHARGHIEITADTLTDLARVMQLAKRLRLSEIQVAQLDAPKLAAVLRVPPVELQRYVSLLNLGDLFPPISAGSEVHRANTSLLLQFLDAYDLLQQTSFDPAELLYLLRHEDLVPAVYTPTEPMLDTKLQDLYSALRAVDSNYLEDALPPLQDALIILIQGFRSEFFEPSERQEREIFSIAYNYILDGFQNAIDAGVPNLVASLPVADIATAWLLTTLDPELETEERDRRTNLFQIQYQTLLNGFQIRSESIELYRRTYSFLREYLEDAVRRHIWNERAINGEPASSLYEFIANSERAAIAIELRPTYTQIVATYAEKLQQFSQRLDRVEQAIIEHLATAFSIPADVVSSFLSPQVSSDGTTLAPAILHLIIAPNTGGLSPGFPAIGNFISLIRRTGTESIAMPLFASDLLGDRASAKLLMIRLAKAARIVRVLNLSAKELQIGIRLSASLGLLDFNALPVFPIPSSNEYSGIEAWIRLKRLQTSMPRGDRDIFDFLAEAHQDSSTLESVLETLNTETGWNIDPRTGEIVDVISVLGEVTVSDFQQIRTYEKLNQIIHWMHNEKLSPPEIIPLGTGGLANVASTLATLAEAQYGGDTLSWYKALTPINNRLRERKRDALIAYLLANPPEPNLRTTNDLYAYLLIDVEMSACQMTSRIVQAHSAVQLFVQRCRLNLEQPEVSLGNAVTESEYWKQWQWMKNYRVWEAARKVFLYPENWIEPDLRDNKSPFFEDLENELLQDDVTQESVERAYRNYLVKLDRVARLDVRGFYEEALDNGGKNLHVIARTYSQPYIYFYRKRLQNRVWTAWEKLDLSLEGDHHLLTMFNGRVMIFWIAFKELQFSDESRRWEISLSWSELIDGQWQAPRKSREQLVRPFLSQEDFTLRLYTGDAPIIALYEQIRASFNSLPNSYSFCLYRFRIDPCTGEADTDRLPSPLIWVHPARVDADSQRLLEDNSAGNQLALNLSAFSDETVDIDPAISDTANELIEKIPGLGVIFAAFLLGGAAIQELREIHEQVRNETILAQTPEIFSISPGHQYRQTLFGQTFFSEIDKRNYIASIKRLSFQTGLTFTNAASLVRGFLGYFLQQYQFESFYHPYFCEIVKLFNEKGVEGILNAAPSDFRIHRQLYKEGLVHVGNGRLEDLGEEPRFTSYRPSNLVWRDREDPYYSLPYEQFDFSLDGAYSIYNWELFFHIPLLVADRLTKNQRFEEAQRWFHYIFNPTDVSIHPSPQKFWQIKPLFEEVQRWSGSTETLEEMMRRLATGADDVEQQVEAWRNDPFNPHLIARLRLVAYMKTVVQKYLDNLIAWGDHRFQEDTRESINEALQLYILAAEILGSRPATISRDEGIVRSYSEIDEGLDAFANVLVDIETSLPAIPLSKPAKPGTEIPPNLILYFCIPSNEKLLGYWDTIGDRLFKIRNCMDIEGQVRQLPLFAPPIDPALLVRARAVGLDLGAIISGELDLRLPHYRYQVLIQKAMEFCGEVRSFGGALLSALEKKDAEDLGLLRSRHEIAMMKLIALVKQQQIDEAQETLEGLRASRKLAEARLDFYSSREFMNALEKANTDNLHVAHGLEVLAGAHSFAAAIAHLFPDVHLSGPIPGTSFGGSHVGRAINATSDMFKLAASQYSFEAAMASTMAGYERRQDEWNLQADLAQKELDQIDKQILAAEIRLAIAEQDQTNHQKQTEQAEEVERFLKSKFTNSQLYSWMVAQLSALHYQAYRMAFDIAKKAEKAAQFELGLSRSEFNYIQFGHWDSQKKGLLAGERLHQDLRRMEVAHLDKNKREFELTKHISLLSLNPLELVKLRETGRCFIDLPEEIFDLDYSGHYFRRIKSVSVTLPCVVGPYTTISCTLRLLKNSLRINTNDAENYPHHEDDDRFIENNIPVKAIATSTAQNDSGVFELSFRDERYLPFEGAGAISQWSLELFNDNSPDFGKALRQFDYSTITDAILHIKYTAREDAGALKNGAIAHLRDYFSEDGTTPSLRMFNLRQEFPSQWHRFLHPINPEEGNNFELEIIPNLFPIRDTEKTLKVNKICLLARCKNKNAGNYTIVVTLPAPEPSPVSEPPPAETHILTLTPVNQYGGLHFSQKDVGIEIDLAATPVKWQLRMSRSGGNVPEEVEDVLLVLGYEWENNA